MHAMKQIYPSCRWKKLYKFKIAAFVPSYDMPTTLFRFTKVS